MKFTLLMKGLRIFSSRSQRRWFSSTSVSASSDTGVARWLFGCAGLTLGMISVGGLTRLTESGLSMTTWRPLAGTIPPIREAEWQEEFQRYKNFPEYKQLRENEGGMDLSEFKRIFYWEWGHRVLGRFIGVAFAVPFGYFLYKKRLSKRLALQCAGVFTLGGLQGAVGWWMVKSGLREELVTENAVPRVSHFRLATHLGSALLIYSGLIWLGLNVATRGKSLQLGAKRELSSLYSSSRLLTGLVYTTALSGALVAGLDAGTVYSEWPLMGGQVVPQEYQFGNLSDDTSVQFNHRWLGMFTAVSCFAMYFYMRRFFPILPARTKRFVSGLALVAAAQTSLGIATLLSVVHVPLAATHQLGSVLLLTASLHVMHDIKRLMRRVVK